MCETQCTDPEQTTVTTGAVAEPTPEQTNTDSAGEDQEPAQD